MFAFEYQSIVGCKIAEPKMREKKLEARLFAEQSDLISLYFPGHWAPKENVGTTVCGFYLFSAVNSVVS